MGRRRWGYFFSSSSLGKEKEKSRNRWGNRNEERVSMYDQRKKNYKKNKKQKQTNKKKSKTKTNKQKENIPKLN